jgi:hypothetical protein
VVKFGTLTELTQVLQASISPVALVSGVGLLILSMTNRFGRVSDRLRELAAQGRRQSTEHPHVPEQIAILVQRARLLRAAISCAVGCVLLSAVEVLLIFFIALVDLEAQLVVVLLFAASLVFLIASLICFLLDLRLSLQALNAELRR